MRIIVEAVAISTQPTALQSSGPNTSASDDGSALGFADVLKDNLTQKTAGDTGKPAQDAESIVEKAGAVIAANIGDAKAAKGSQEADDTDVIDDSVKSETGESPDVLINLSVQIAQAAMRMDMPEAAQQAVDPAGAEDNTDKSASRAAGSHAFVGEGGLESAMDSGLPDFMQRSMTGALSMNIGSFADSKESERTDAAGGGWPVESNAGPGNAQWAESVGGSSFFVTDKPVSAINDVRQHSMLKSWDDILNNAHASDGGAGSIGGSKDMPGGLFSFNSVGAAEAGMLETAGTIDSVSVSGAGDGSQIAGFAIPTQVTLQSDVFSVAGAESIDTSNTAEMSQRIIDQVVREVKLNQFKDHSDLMIRLNPPELGALRIHITQDAQGLTSQIEAGSSQVQNLLQANLSQLVEAFSSAGVNMESISVTSGTSFGAFMQDSSQQQAQQFEGRNSGRNRNLHGDSISEAGVAGLHGVSDSLIRQIDITSYSWLA